jgi:hypothetical protein
MHGPESAECVRMHGWLELVCSGIILCGVGWLLVTEVSGWDYWNF